MTTPREQFAQETTRAISLGLTLPQTDSRFRKLLGPLDVLWTVPHGAPGNDAIAPEVGLIADEASKALGLESLLLVSVCDRYTRVDMNRPESRQSEFRGAIREVLSMRHPRYLIDVHSFPNQYPKYSGRDIIVLHTPGVTDLAFARHFATLLKVAALKLGKRAVVEVQNQHQPVIHDIVKEAGEFGMSPKTYLLVEYNESGDGKLYGQMSALAIKSLVR